MHNDRNKPCAECPFLKKSMKGWLGPWNPQSLLSEIERTDLAFACHMSIPDEDDFDPEEASIQVCAGALAYANHNCKLSRKRHIAEQQKRVGKPDHVIKTAEAFHAHHKRK